VRPRIHRRLARRFDHRVITLVAGAGFGKTTALVHALAENSLEPHGRDVWLTCEPADSSASTLLAALERSITGNHPDRSSATTVDDVCAAVWAEAPVHVCLVIDDAHRIEPDSPGTAALVALADQLPANGHLVIASRRRVPVPLARLLGHGRADEIDEDALRLDGTEITALAAAHDVDAADMDDVRGWPALVELIASAGGEAAERFVGEEVLNGLSSPQRRALALLSAIGGADAATATAVCGHRVDPSDFAHIPLVAHDHAGTIRPHSLWEQLLQHELDDVDVTTARLTAATSLQERGRHAEAYELLVAARQWDAALPVLFDACTDHVDPPWADVMDRWCRLLPPELADAPEAKYARGMIARGTDPWQPAVSLIEDAAHELARRGDRRRALAAGVRASFTSIVHNDPTWSQRGTGPIRERSARGEALQAVESITLATVDLIEGRHRDCIRHANLVGELEPRLRHFPGYYTGVSLLGLGDPDAAITPAIEGANAAKAIVPAAGSCWAMSLPDAARLAAGRLADVDVDRLIDPGTRFSIAERVPLIALGVIARANTGRLDAAAHLLGHIEALLLPSMNRPLVDGWRAVAAAAVAVANGDETKAARELDRGLGPDTEVGLRAGGAGQALLWFPAHAWLVDERSRTFLERCEHGPHRRRVLTACSAIERMRAGERIAATDLALLDDINAAVAALGLQLTVEAVLRSTLSHANAIAREIADRWPQELRAILHRHADGPDSTIARAAQRLAAAVPLPPSHHVSIRSTGDSSIALDGVEVKHANWRRVRVRQLIGCLVMHRRLRRQQLADLLWPDADADGSSANLRMTLSYAQTLLEPTRARGDAPWFLHQDAGILTLRSCPELDVDIWALEEHLGRAAAHRSDGRPTLELASLEQALDNWHGDAFTDLADFEWATSERERIRARAVSACERAAALLEAAGRGVEAEAIAERGLTADPWNETLHLHLIRSRTSAGDRAGALAAYDRCRRSLGEIGAPMPPQAREMITLVRRTDTRPN
jgi:LuxR family transcriptional regulator, maltose regulon positive regulatory protein